MASIEPFVSVITPSYNSKSMLEINLYSFFQQTYPSSKFEVIVVDDGSTDDTVSMCHSINTPFTLKILNTGENSGRSRARNLGASAAEGDIIIFCDGDTIQPPEFIANHVNCHVYANNWVLSSLPLYFALCFTHYYEDFADWQKEMLFNFEPDLKGKVANGARIIEPQKILCDFAYAEKLCFFPPYNEVYRDIINYYQTIGTSPVDWFCFTTRNVSLNRYLFKESGGFDENFRHWGYEDWEIGYRLKTLGANYACKKEVINLHQEHPTNPFQRDNSKLQNYLYFCSKYNNPELYLFSRVWGPNPGQQPWSLFFYCKLVSQYLDISDSHRYDEFCRLFCSLASADFRLRLLNEKPDVHDDYMINRCLKTRNRLNKSHKELAESFQELLTTCLPNRQMKKCIRILRPPRKRKRKPVTGSES